MSIILEVCIGSVADARSALVGGADRLELNMGLELGGLTPSAGVLKEVMREVEGFGKDGGKRVGLLVMVRCRGGGFVYSEDEKKVMLEDAKRLLGEGADGIVFGGLNSDGTIDEKWTTAMCGVCAMCGVGGVVVEKEKVFHRAFDLLEDQMKGIEVLKGLEVCRVLTSGGARTAMEGMGILKKLVEVGGVGGVEVLAGAGVNAENVERLVKGAGCRQVHGSFSQWAADDGGFVGGDGYTATCLEKVQAVREVLDGIK